MFDSRCPGYSLLPRFQEDWEELDIRDDVRNYVRKCAADAFRLKFRVIKMSATKAVFRCGG